MGLVVADVSGHGLSAAIIMSAFRALARTGLRAGQSLDEVAGTLDRELPDTTAGSAFVTAVLATYDPASGRLRYVNCGHNPPLLDRPGQPPHWLETGGPLLGLIDDATFEIGEVQLVPGDQLVIFTDGIVEARSPAGVWFGTERLASLVTAQRGQRARALVDQIVGEARMLAGVRGLEDDATMLLLRRTR
jgi:serine phosphatase RsbU (regulator of sigma subunit)